jgi:hypothetical protein
MHRVAYGHGRLVRTGISTLLEFETSDLGFTVDAAELQRFAKTELAVWHERSRELVSYQIVRKR